MRTINSDIEIGFPPMINENPHRLNNKTHQIIVGIKFLFASSIFLKVSILSL